MQVWSGPALKRQPASHSAAPGPWRAGGSAGGAGSTGTELICRFLTQLVEGGLRVRVLREVTQRECGARSLTSSLCWGPRCPSPHMGASLGTPGPAALCDSHPPSPLPRRRGPERRWEAEDHEKKTGIWVVAGSSEGADTGRGTWDLLTKQNRPALVCPYKPDGRLWGDQEPEHPLEETRRP